MFFFCVHVLFCQAEDDISDPAHKSGSNKKSRKAGFGSLFDKRTPDKMNETEVYGKYKMILTDQELQNQIQCLRKFIDR